MDRPLDRGRLPDCASVRLDSWTGRGAKSIEISSPCAVFPIGRAPFASAISRQALYLRKVYCCFFRLPGSTERFFMIRVSENEGDSAIGLAIRTDYSIFIFELCCRTVLPGWACIAETLRAGRSGASALRSHNKRVRGLLNCSKSRQLARQTLYRPAHFERHASGAQRALLVPRTDLRVGGDDRGDAWSRRCQTD